MLIDYLVEGLESITYIDLLTGIWVMLLITAVITSILLVIIKFNKHPICILIAGGICCMGLVVNLGVYTILEDKRLEQLEVDSKIDNTNLIKSDIEYIIENLKDDNKDALTRYVVDNTSLDNLENKISSLNDDILINNIETEIKYGQYSIKIEIKSGNNTIEIDCTGIVKGDTLIYKF